MGVPFGFPLGSARGFGKTGQALDCAGPSFGRSCSGRDDRAGEGCVAVRLGYPQRFRSPAESRFLLSRFARASEVW